MNSVNSQTIARVADFLGGLQKKRVSLWSENGRLRYKAPKGVVTHEEIETLKAFRGHIVALLESAASAEIAEPKLEPRPQLDRAPLAFSQVAHWNLYGLGERPSLCISSSVTRLHGKLNIEAMKRSVAEIECRHEALRTRIVLCDGVPVQEIAEPGAGELKVFDLTVLSADVREAEVRCLVEKCTVDPINVLADPLFKIWLARLHETEHVLIIAMEHIVTDGFSLKVLLRDLFTAYVQAVQGRDFSLPEIPIQFADYAVWQRNAQKSWLEKHGAYWRQRLEGCQRLRFPADTSLPAAANSGWGIVRLQIDRELKAELHEWSRLRQTTLVMSVFTAYIALVLRWCSAHDGVILYQTDGRISPKIENSIGYFASVLYLRMKILPDDTFIDLAGRVVEEYCKAYEHADFSYIEAQVPRPEFTRNSCFNWVPLGSRSELAELEESVDALSYSRYPVESKLARFERDTEPMAVFLEAEDEIRCNLTFSMGRLSFDTMERFGRNFVMFVRALLRQPQQRIKDIELCK